MKSILISLLILYVSCNQPSDNTNQLIELQNQVNELQKKLDDSYKPGFGSFMSGIQIHHAKLWFAGENQNWKLAEFEVHEITEAFEDIKKFKSERKETQLLPMINPMLDSISKAIQQKDPSLFKNSFILLTQSCNNCHQTANLEFNEIKIPNTPPFSNQEFKNRKKE